MKNIKKLLAELKDGANELIASGNSNEKSEGNGRLDVINQIEAALETKLIRILSPDGFSINIEGTFLNKKKALEFYTNWSKRFEAQGHYSSKNGKIPLNELKNNCQFINC